MVLQVLRTDDPDAGAGAGMLCRCSIPNSEDVQDNCLIMNMQAVFYPFLPDDTRIRKSVSIFLLLALTYNLYRFMALIL